MYKVIDTNRFQSEELKAYFTKFRQNYAVLTDFAAMEAYKGNTLTSLNKSMEIFSQYPKQVIVLKSTGIVCGLSGRRAGLQRRLIDERQTREFEKYCSALHAAKRGNTSVQTRLLELGHKATAHMDQMLVEAPNIPDIIDDLASNTYTSAELRIIRTSGTYTPEMLGKMMKNVTLLSIKMFGDHPRVTKKPPLPELVNTYIFRMALCGNLLAQEWIAVGGAKNVKPERMRNDVVDMGFAAYATYFDDLLTYDDKLKRIYRNAVFWIDAISKGIGNITR